MSYRLNMSNFQCSMSKRRSFAAGGMARDMTSSVSRAFLLSVRLWPRLCMRFTMLMVELTEVNSFLPRDVRLKFLPLLSLLAPTLCWTSGFIAFILWFRCVFR